MSDAINLEVWPTHPGSDSGSPPPTKKARWTLFLKGERERVNKYLKCHVHAAMVADTYKKIKDEEERAAKMEKAMNDLDPILEAKYFLTDKDLKSLSGEGTTSDVYDAYFYVM